MTAVFGIVMIMVAFIMFPMIMTSTQDIITDEAIVTESVTTGPDNSCVDLDEDLYDDDIDNVESITSDNIADDPDAVSYYTGNNSIVIDGLNPDDTRTLTITYLYDATTDFTGLGDLSAIAPTILMVALIGVGVAMLYRSWKGG